MEPNIPSPMAASVHGPPFVAVPSALPSSLFLKRPVTVLECHSESKRTLQEVLSYGICQDPVFQMHWILKL